jgi:hypothetical protein
MHTIVKQLLAGVGSNWQKPTSEQDGTGEADAKYHGKLSTAKYIRWNGVTTLLPLPSSRL